MEVATYLEERAWVGLTIRVGSSVVHPTAEMMFPMRGAIGYLQSFRVTSFRAEERQMLEKEITVLIKQTMTPATAGHGSGFRPPRFYLESF